MSWMIGVDTGGTFTDVIALNRDTGDLRTLKVSSTPRDPSQAIAAGIQGLIDAPGDFSAADVSFFAHGTTVATNAVIERKGSRTGLLITEGTNAVYIARMSRQPEGYEAMNPDLQKPAPLVPLSKTREVEERLAYDGEVLKPLKQENVLAQLRDLVEKENIESLAVCFLFSFMRSDHEKAALEAVRKEFPNIRVSLSSDLLPIVREYRRLSTTVLDAYVGPTLDGYLRRLAKGLAEAGLTTKQIFIMQSNGGLMSIDVASSNPVQTLLSGPAAGVISGKYLGEITGFKNLVTFDVGGTSTDVATIIDGENEETTLGGIAGHDSSVPMSEIGTIGAGGGTIARISKEGRLLVGPESAGADPGPVCYRKGGVEPTSTDASLVLGFLDPASSLGGGNVKIDRDSAAQAIEEQIAKPLALSVEEAAHGIVKILCSHMEGEIRLRLMSRGHSPKRFALVAMGGAGPMYASMVAKSLGFQAVLVPPYPGLGSAMGLILTDIRHTYLQSRPGLLETYDTGVIAKLFGDLCAKAAAEAETEGTPLDDLRFDRFLELRYVGQGYELPIPCPENLSDSDKDELCRRFHEQHEKVFGHAATDSPVELVNCRVDSIATLPKLQLPKAPAARRGEAIPQKGSRQVYFGDAGGLAETPVYERSALHQGDRILGPAIIDQADSTTVLLPQQTLEVDGYGNLILRFE
ncbi:MAG: hydantoinase/oxoprolinase family protein [Rhodovibrionaceae bacterium]